MTATQMEIISAYGTKLIQNPRFAGVFTISLVRGTLQS
jgi:hypothetical protein